MMAFSLQARSTAQNKKTEDKKRTATSYQNWDIYDQDSGEDQEA